MSVLITGGAGYIGSHVNKLLSRSGYSTIVYDNLIGGHRSMVRWGQFVQGDLENETLLDRVFRENKIEAVFHFASYLNVGESVLQPAKYYYNNVINTYRLLEAMRRNGCKTIVFSSTCATYGQPEKMPITEETVQNPINPYGNTKWIAEKMFQDYAAAYGLRYVALRYFNAAGADPEGEIGEWHDPEPHIIPRLLETAQTSGVFKLYGTDYPTRDGTCIRDYIHVADLAQAHLLALEYLGKGGESGFFNLGNTAGTSNLEVIDAVRHITGMPITIEQALRRTGDPPVLIGDSGRARKLLGWQPQYPDIETIVEHAWKWHCLRESM